jgi:hypothetical protein
MMTQIALWYLMDGFLSFRFASLGIHNVMAEKDAIS